MDMVNKEKLNFRSNRFVPIEYFNIDDFAQLSPIDLQILGAGTYQLNMVCNFFD